MPQQDYANDHWESSEGNGTMEMEACGIHCRDYKGLMSKIFTSTSILYMHLLSA